NLSAVNTAGDDEAPFYHAPSKSLVFASNGLVGLGGYDLYITKGSIGGSFEAPKNMGYPVNSVKDDIYYLSTDAKSVWNNAYLSSDRNSECCLDIYSFNRASVMKTISGTVVDCATGSAVGGAMVQVKDGSGKVVYSGTTNSNGRYEFKVNDYAAFNTTATVTGYEDGKVAIAIPGDAEQETLAASNLCVTKIRKEVEEKPVENVAVVLDDVKYDYDAYKLSSASIKSLDVLLKLMKDNPNMKVEIIGHTDGKGTEAYNQALSERRAQSCVNYLTSKGISKDRLVAIGKGTSEPVADNETADGKDNPEGRAKNRRTEFKILN
ncbi:OmpA family protein, partial [Polluticaenibacter yanchengensis]|nr:OmpA family protein [Chitinophagaceae bacterium LY-5]